MNITEEVIDKIMFYTVLNPTEPLFITEEVKQILDIIRELIKNNEELIKTFDLKEIQEKQQEEGYLGGLIWMKPSLNGIRVLWGNGTEIFITSDHLKQINTSYLNNQEKVLKK